MYRTAWLAVVAGAKRWFIYEPGTMPAVVRTRFNPLVSTRAWSQKEWAMIASLSASQQPIVCDQMPGEMLVLPERWIHATMNLGETVAIGGQVPGLEVPAWIAAAKDTNARAAARGEKGGDHDAHRLLGKFGRQQHSHKPTYAAMDPQHLQAAMALSPLSVDLPIMIAKHYLETSEAVPAKQFTEHTVSLLLDAHNNPDIAPGTTLRFALEVAKLCHTLGEQQWMDMMLNIVPVELADQLRTQYNVQLGQSQGAVTKP